MFSNPDSNGSNQNFINDQLSENNTKKNLKNSYLQITSQNNDAHFEVV